MICGRISTTNFPAKKVNHVRYIRYHNLKRISTSFRKVSINFLSDRRFYFMTEDLIKVVDLLKLRNCSKQTINNYISAIKKFKKHYEGENIKDFNEEKILKYLNSNFVNKCGNASTINVNRAAIKYYYLVVFDKDFKNALLPSCKVKSKLPKVFSRNDIITLLKNSKSLRIQLTICLGYGSGLRISEVASLNIKNIDLKNKRIKVLVKGGKERYVPLPNFTLKLLKIYYSRNETIIKKAEGYIFPSKNKKSKQPHLVSDVLAASFRALLIKCNFSYNYTFHTLRHSFATHYIENDGDIWKLKAFLGHSSINTTMIYLHLAENFTEIISPLDEVVK